MIRRSALKLQKVVPPYAVITHVPVVLIDFLKPYGNGALDNQQYQIPQNNPDNGFLTEVPEGTDNLDGAGYTEHGYQENGQDQKNVP